MPTVADLADILSEHRPTEGVYVVGLTGGVASGKSTLAATLADSLEALPYRPRVERIGTDGFLHPNSILAERGVLDRKGFPETYDRAAMIRALNQVRSGPTVFPGYSHSVYDVEPALARTIDRPDIVIVEGLGLDRGVPLDILVYLDADRIDQEAWYVSRFLDLWELGRDDTPSFYARFRDMDGEAVRQLAARVWRQMNLPNLEAHIEPVREFADILARKRSDHTIETIVCRP